MTKEQLKNTIDLHITNVTVNKGVSNVNVGEDMKSVVDFTAQEIDTLNTAKVDKIVGRGLSENNFTSALKTAYDNAVTWVTTNGANILAHLTNISNPHGVTKEQVGLSNVPNIDFTNDIAGKQDNLIEGTNISIIDNVISATGGGLNSVSIDSNSFDGNGTFSYPLKNKFYYRTSQIYASGGGAPIRNKNFFSGMQLPAGVTETFTRVSAGIYRATYSGADTVEDLDITNISKLFHFSFSNMPTNLGSDLKIQTIGATLSGGIRTIFVEFHNLPNGILTDNFGGYLYYEVKFFQ